MALAAKQGGMWRFTRQRISSRVGKPTALTQLLLSACCCTRGPLHGIWVLKADEEADKLTWALAIPSV